ncbi:uncharacterized protein LOC132210466 [Stegostoma tigrinum]|uniref:uncharacterized protein LOC132210466 n=1 Tax=Stegostoma tigrinum TaxID=3053191 RepID=UPI002870954C|nr:uncharacterized protein LOC132210466 [Stegostoma tigrinum]XP_059506614.1 uncharacterized protein LOC132210466 [Stegostoma tigrinum]
MPSTSSDDTTSVGQISNNDKSKYGREIEGLVTGCNENNLSLNAGKTKEMIIDFRKRRGERSPIYINGDDVERVSCIKFLGVRITNHLSWTSHIDVTVKKTQQRLFFLRRLRKFVMSVRLLTNFYRCTIETKLSECIMAWYGNCSAQDCKKLQKVECAAQTITEANFPSTDSIYMACCCRKAANIIKTHCTLVMTTYNLFHQTAGMEVEHTSQQVGEQLLSSHY